MSAWTWILGGVLAYWLLLSLYRDRLPNWVGTMGPILTVHTKRGRAMLDRLGAPRRLWRLWANLGLGFALVVLVGAFLLLIVNAAALLRSPPAATAINQPQNFLVIPGVNDFLPLAVAPEIVLGLFLGMLVHELGHGILSRVEDIEVESMGVVLLAILPIGAFVEPSEESVEAADRGSRARMFAAGVTNNFLLTAIAFALLFGPVVGSIAVAPGAAVGGTFAGSPADTAGIEAGDRIVAIENRSVQTNTDLEDALATADGEVLTVRLGDGTETRVERSVLITGMAADSPFAELGTNATIVSVDGQSVRTEAALRDTLANTTAATFETAGGEQARGPVGALVSVVDDGPAARAGLPADSAMVVTHIEGERIVSQERLNAVLDGFDPGETVSVTAVSDGDTLSESVELDEQDGTSYLGVQVYRGVSGMVVSDVGASLYPAETYLQMVAGETTGGGIIGFVRAIGVNLILPLVGSIGLGGLEYNFAGFVGSNAGFYAIEGPLEGLGGGVFVIANVLFWTGWINLNLAAFNCIPAFPLDGGHLLRMMAESVVARLPVEEKAVAVRAITTSVGVTMLLALVLMLFGPQLLGG